VYYQPTLPRTVLMHGQRTAGEFSWLAPGTGRLAGVPFVPGGRRNIRHTSHPRQIESARVADMQVSGFRVSR